MNEHTLTTRDKNQALLSKAISLKSFG